MIKPDVGLHVQDALEINFEMTLGSASESITVEAGAPAGNAESAAVNTVIDRTFVENLALNGRSFQTLIMLTPGVVLTATAFDDQGQFSVNGQRADANYFTVDGVSANFGVTGFAPLMQSAGGALPALNALGGTNSLVSLDAMLEFRIQTSSFAPGFGRTPGRTYSIFRKNVIPVPFRQCPAWARGSRLFRGHWQHVWRGLHNNELYRVVRTIGSVHFILRGLPSAALIKPLD